MSSKNSRSSKLYKKFPFEKLSLIDFGAVDGGKDNISQSAFIETSSVDKFLLNRHSIVVGAIGAGKSTLFKLLRDHSHEYENYKNDLIVTIEESLAFSELEIFVSECFSGREPRILYQLIWKFNTLLRIAEKLAVSKDFPTGDSENSINAFLKRCGGQNSVISVIEKIRKFVIESKLSLVCKVADFPISIGVEVKGDDQTSIINLDKIQVAVEGSIKRRGYAGTTVIIDKLDKFISGRSKEVQNSYLEALLEFDDDLSSSPLINLKIFLRKDLFERLDFATLGYDKALDNCVMLEWSESESLMFLARRIAVGFEKAGIVGGAVDLLEGSRLPRHQMSLKERMFFSPNIPGWLKKTLGLHYAKRTNLYDLFSKTVLSRVFPDDVIHYCAIRHSIVSINIFNFLNTHFLDASSTSNPRHLLTFLKKINELAIKHYAANPHLVCNLTESGGVLRWNVFNPDIIYEAYKDVRESFIRSLVKLNPEWISVFDVFLKRIGGKVTFDFRWLKKNSNSFSDDMLFGFIDFLRSLSFIRLSENHSDPKKIQYEIPLLFRGISNSTGGNDSLESILDRLMTDYYEDLRK